MPGSLQQFLATETKNAATELEKALLRLPEDKRGWSPMGSARTALDMVAECAMLSDVTKIVETRSFPKEFDFADYLKKKAEVATLDWDKLRTMLHESTDRSVKALLLVPDEDLGVQIEMPWGPISLAQVISYPYWNMSYHTGQINYLASMLGCLE
jgi:hypothetical protein